MISIYYYFYKNFYCLKWRKKNVFYSFFSSSSQKIQFFCKLLKVFKNRALKTIKKLSNKNVSFLKKIKKKVFLKNLKRCQMHL